MNSAKPLLLFFISMIVVLEIYCAQHSRIRRREIFYGLAALMLFAGFMVLYSG